MVHKGFSLTIAIPTYNRSKYLYELLQVLAPQLKGKEQDVELIISDNASSDETDIMLRELAKDGLVFKLYRNDENLGADANILQCFAKAKGKYVWICGDDDLILPGSLDKLLVVIAKDDYDLVYLDSISFSSRNEIDLFAKRDFETTICDSPEEFVRHVNIFVTFISANIVNKDRLSSICSSPLSQLLGTNLLQLGWIFPLLNTHRRSLIVRGGLVAARKNNTGGYALFKVFGKNLLSIIHTLELRRNLARLIINSALQDFFPPYILKARSNDTRFVEEDPDAILRPLFWKNVRYWIFDFPLMVCPGRCAKWWMLVVRILNKFDRATGRHLLR